MARSTLFRNPFFAWLIRSLRAIPIDQTTADMPAIRRCIQVMKEGGCLLIFPEGARTEVGTTTSFAPGTMVLIRRARPTVVPVAVEGAQHIWPRGRSVPKLRGRIAAMYGAPIPADELLDQPVEEVLKRLERQIESMRRELARRLSH